LRAETGAKVIPALDYDERDRALELNDASDALLLDSTEDGAGGTGETGDWEATRELTRELSAPVVLAGGLSPENVREAAQTVRPGRAGAAINRDLGRFRLFGFRHKPFASFAKKCRTLSDIRPFRQSFHSRPTTGGNAALAGNGFFSPS
jgi:hypothetical protein